MRVNIAGVLVDNLTTEEALQKVTFFVQSNEKSYIVTPYSEMIVFAMDDPSYREALNGAGLSLADGIGIVWAAKFLEKKAEGRGRRAEILIHLVKTLFAIIINPKYIRSVIPEQVTGRELIFDIAKIAQEKNFTIAMVGGHDNVAVKAADKLRQIYPGLKINLAMSPNAFDDQTVQMIASSNSDILIIAYSPPKQEMWIAQNLDRLNVKLAMGLGGTFDYLAGNRPVAPKFVHYLGLEWLWRLITQPRRIKRIWNAVPVFIFKILKYKLANRK